MKEENYITNLGFYLNRVFSKLINMLNSRLEEEHIPLNHAQFEVMQLLWNKGNENFSQQEIANIIGRDKAAISRALKHLELHGFIERKAASGSKNNISLTQKGVDIQPVLETILVGIIQTLCKPLTEEESRQLISLLSRIY